MKIHISEQRKTVSF